MSITRKDVEVIFHSRNWIYHNGEPWAKKKDGSFDVTIGAYDGAEVCKLISIYMLYFIGKKYNSENIGLHAFFMSNTFFKSSLSVA